MLFSGAVAALVERGREAWAARRRAHARRDEVALVAAAVQRWRLTPAGWGGAGLEDGGLEGASFRGVSFEAVGLAACPVTGRRRTASGVYQVVHVPAGPVLDRALARVGRGGGTDGVLVVGRDPVTFQTSAAIVLGPLLQVPLASVPWHLVTPVADLEDAPDPGSADLEAEAPKETLEGAPDLEGAVRPARRVSRRRVVDREPLALALWPGSRAPASRPWLGTAAELPSPSTASRRRWR